MAHSASVNCLNIGKKACRLFITGGDDHKVNLWTIGKPTSLMVSAIACFVFCSILIGIWVLLDHRLGHFNGGSISNASYLFYNCYCVFITYLFHIFGTATIGRLLRNWDLLP